jgi:hypothetical protein
MDKESVWRKLKILFGVYTPFFDYLSSDLSIDRHILSYFDHKIFRKLPHVTSILVRSYYIGLEIALNFLNAH